MVELRTHDPDLVTAQQQAWGTIFSAAASWSPHPVGGVSPPISEPNHVKP